MAAAFGVALLLFLPFWDEPWLLPSFVGALGSLVALGILYPLSRLFVAKRVPWQAFGPLVAILGYILLIFSYATEIGRYLHSLFREGLAYFFDSELSRVGVEEAMPIFRVYDLASLSILGLIFALGGLFILARGVRPSTGLRPDRLLFLIWAGLAAALAISQPGSSSSSRSAGQSSSPSSSSGGWKRSGRRIDLRGPTPGSSGWPSPSSS
jgi:dolichyl-diphosphooligosaccharide--protein glycosyltransferase